MDTDRSWMYTRIKDGRILGSFEKGVDSFIAFALAHPDCMKFGDMKCPCNAKKMPEQAMVETRRGGATLEE